VSNDLQLCDYAEGYRFQMKCGSCGFEWYETPAEILASPLTHSRMYLDEVAATLKCINCKQYKAKITPLLVRSTHHFVGGMA